MKQKRSDSPDSFDRTPLSPEKGVGNCIASHTRSRSKSRRIDENGENTRPRRQSKQPVRHDDANYAPRGGAERIAPRQPTPVERERANSEALGDNDSSTKPPPFEQKFV